jgi:hypothetical protein
MLENWSLAKTERESGNHLVHDRCPLRVNLNTKHRILHVFDFTLGTHPISTKGTTELGRSEATKRF